MERIIDLHLKFYQSLFQEKKCITEALSNQGISVLTGFVDNVHLVRDFYESCYKNDNRRIVLCGINPGRLGAGKTGVPFLDYLSLSKLLNGIDNKDSELSAKFIFSIIESIGIERFFDHVYLTNISWFGFVKGNKNVNYYELGEELQREFTYGFIKEMEIIQPQVIIPLSKKVKKTLMQMKKENLLDAKIAPPLSHPYYYSNFKSRYEEGFEKYKEVIENYTA
ncbi:MAG: uracil-DNA glycosylase family protein [Bacillus sp. (in: firmicutes)]